MDDLNRQKQEENEKMRAERDAEELRLRKAQLERDE